MSFSRSAQLQKREQKAQIDLEAGLVDGRDNRLARFGQVLQQIDYRLSIIGR